ncbi:MAG: DUF2127 domain-containing protein [Candidatus Gracilibacteria bacterium]|jgi:uncharacterized membrane protein
MKFFTKKSAELVFLVLYEGVLGGIEILLGLAFLINTYFLNHSDTSQILEKVIQRELAEDPQDFLANWTLDNHFHITGYIGFAIAAVGFVKILITIGLITRSEKMRIISIFLLAVISGIGIYEIAAKFSVIKLVLLSIDLVMLHYFIFLAHKHFDERSLRD